MVKRLIFAMQILLLAASAAAQETDTSGGSEVTLPALDDFVLSLEIPPGWEVFFGGEGDLTKWHTKDGVEPLGMPVTLHNKDMLFTMVLRMFVYDSPLSLEYFVAIKDMATKTDTTLQLGTDQSYGRQSFSHTKAAKAGSTDPDRHEAVTVLRDRVGISAAFIGDLNTFAARQAAFEKIARTISVTPIAELDADTVWRYYVSPEIAITPGKNWLNGTLSLAVPPGWDVEEIELVQGGLGGAAAGRFVVDLIPEDSFEETAFTIVLDGKAYDERLNAAQFIATRDPLVASLANDILEIDTEIDAGMPEPERQGSGIYPLQDGFCLSESRTRRFRQTDGVAVKSYRGKDVLTGEDTRLRVYTAGGVTLACNMIFRAPPDRFNQLLPTVDRIVRSTKVKAAGLIMLK